MLVQCVLTDWFRLIVSSFIWLSDWMIDRTLVLGCCPWCIGAVWSLTKLTASRIIEVTQLRQFVDSQPPVDGLSLARRYTITSWICTLYSGNASCSVGDSDSCSSQWLGRLSYNWYKEYHTARRISLVFVVLQCKLVSGWGLRKWKISIILCALWLGKDFVLVVAFCAYRLVIVAEVVLSVVWLRMTFWT